MEQKKRVVVFGIFDGVHAGHRALFRQAKEKGDELIVIVGRNILCERLKGKTPRRLEAERVAAVTREPWVDEAVLGDQTISTYGVLEKLQPHAVCFGYDQELLERDFKRWAKAKGLEIEIHVLEPFEPDRYHTSLLNGTADLEN